MLLKTGAHTHLAGGMGWCIRAGPMVVLLHWDTQVALLVEVTDRRKLLLR